MTSFAAAGGGGSKVVLGLWWFPIKTEQEEGFTGGRESFWWREWRGGGPGCGERSWDVAAAVPAGVGEDGLFLSN